LPGVREKKKTKKKAWKLKVGPVQGEHCADGCKNETLTERCGGGNGKPRKNRNKRSNLQEPGPTDRAVKRKGTSVVTQLNKTTSHNGKHLHEKRKENEKR